MEQILTKALGQDVSKLAAQEKQLLLSRLLARLAHEIRNPLSSMAIHVQLLEEDVSGFSPELREKTANRFDIIQGELHRLEIIVRQFINLAGPSTLHLEWIEPRKVIGHVCELLRPEAAARGVELVAELPAELPKLLADEVQLTQALVNLVINAIQAIEERGTVRVQAEVRPEEILIEVRDTGRGVPPEKQSDIFEPFFTTKSEGSGLGLWIVQQILIAHGGSASVKNAPEGGAIFTLRLPRSTGKTSHE